MTELGTAVRELAASSRSEFVMCAPFAKRVVVDRVLSVVPRDVEVTLYTRWRPEEVAAGVSDTQVLSTLGSRGGAVYLHDRLHAKFYRNESQVLLGSANLTGAALGWSANPNIELLVPSSRGAIAEVERYLASQSTQATEALAREVEEIATLLPHPQLFEPDDIKPSTRVDDFWVPQLRMPSDLYSAYCKGPHALASRSAAAATVDLVALDLPVGLDKRQFELLVGHRLRCQPLFLNIDRYLEQPRRFGELRQQVTQLTGYDRVQADEAVQTMMRWMLEFLPERYARKVKRHTEVISRIATPAESRQ